jgi:hypothetical protein
MQLKRKPVGQTMNVYRVWNDIFGEIPPIGHLMRRSLADRWLRIHSLPKSKRYAENELEYSVLLERNARVCREILGEAKDTILFVPVWGDGDLAPRLPEFNWASRAGLTNATPKEFPHAEPDEPPIRIVGSTICWSDQLWLDLLRDVADDRTRAVLLNPDTGEVYAPYDGGADLFLANHGRVKMLKRHWSAWLSAHPEGL